MKLYVMSHIDRTVLNLQARTFYFFFIASMHSMLTIYQTNISSWMLLFQAHFFSSVHWDMLHQSYKHRIIDAQQGSNHHVAWQLDILCQFWSSDQLNNNFQKSKPLENLVATKQNKKIQFRKCLNWCQTEKS